MNRLSAKDMYFQIGSTLDRLESEIISRRLVLGSGLSNDDGLNVLEGSVMTVVVRVLNVGTDSMGKYAIVRIGDHTIKIKLNLIVGTYVSDV